MFKVEDPTELPHPLPAILITLVTGGAFVYPAAAQFST